MSVPLFEPQCIILSNCVVFQPVKASFIFISGTTELRRLHRHTAAGWSAIGLYNYISSVSFWRNAELSVWHIYSPLAIREVLLLPRHVAIKQGMCSDGVGQATKVAQYYIRPSQTC